MKTFVLSLIIFLFSAPAFSQNIYQDVELGFSVTFPEGWSPKRGEFVYLETVNPAKPTTGIHIAMQELPDLKALGLKGVDILDLIDAKQMFSSRSTSLVNAGEMTLGKRRALFAEFSVKTKQSGITVALRTMIIFTTYRNNVFCISASALAKSQEEAAADLKELKPIFRTVAESIVFEDPMLNKQVTLREVIFAVLWRFCTYFLLMIGLPFWLRYGYLRRPLDRATALSCAIGFWVASTVVFPLITLPSQWIFNLALSAGAWALLQKPGAPAAEES